MKSSAVRKVYAWAVVPGVVACLSLSAAAQGSSAASAETATSKTAQTSGASASGTNASPQDKPRKDAKNHQKAQLRQLTASQMIGMSVRGAQGNNIGQIDDLAIDMNTGEVRFAVLKFDPGFFAGERLVPIPVKELRMGPERNSLSYQNANKEKLQKASVAEHEWTHAFLKDKDRLGKLEEAWGLPRTGAANMLVRANDIMDREVQNRSGENIGEIEDLVINMDQQKVHYALLELERGWLSPDRTIAVPLSSFTNAAGSGDELVMDLTRDKVKGVQGLSRDQMRDPNDPRVVTIVERHFVFLEPAKGLGSSASPSTSAGKSGTQASGASPANAAADTRR